MQQYFIALLEEFYLNGFVVDISGNNDELPAVWNIFTGISTNEHI